jgi:predicted acylesterase/phospholipase RssA
MPRAENLPIDSSHSALTKFSGPEDPSLQSVLDALGRLMLKAERLPDHTHLSKTQPQDPSDGLRVLALDGGGVKGLFSILVLEAVMEAVQQIDAPEASELPKPCEYFNLICGTSTGGLLAIMLGRLQMDIRACKQAYRDLSRGIFEKTVWEFPGTKWIDALLNKPWYSAEKLEIAIKGILSQHLSSDEKKDLGARKVPVGDAPLHPSHDLITRCFVCALPDSKRQCDRLRTYIPAGDDEPPALKIWEVGRATSAAPLYFPPITICGTKYFDGGMQSNNPILEATREANKEYSTKSVAAMVSIGTGSREPPSQGGGLINLIKSMVSRVTDTEAKDQDFKDFFPGLKDVYFRLQERTHLGSIDLAAWEKLDEIEELANGYLKSAEGQAQVRSCAEKIARGEVGAEEIAA